MQGISRIVVENDTEISTGSIYGIDLASGPIRLTFPADPGYGDMLQFSVVRIGGQLTCDGNGHDITGLTGTAPTWVRTPVHIWPEPLLVQFEGNVWHMRHPEQEFLHLVDTPESYVGSGHNLVAVKTDESGIEFVPATAFEHGFPYVWDGSSTVMDDPGDGNLRLNHADPAQVTEIAIDTTDREGGTSAYSLLASKPMDDLFFWLEPDWVIRYEIVSMTIEDLGTIDPWIHYVVVMNDPLTDIAGLPVPGNCWVRRYGTPTAVLRFSDLIDSPANYGGAANQIVHVTETASGVDFAASDLSAGNNRITNVANPTAAGDAVNRTHFDARQVNTGTGLTGGGNLSANRTISPALQNLTTNTAPGTGWTIPVNNGAAHYKVTLNNALIYATDQYRERYVLTNITSGSWYVAHRANTGWMNSQGYLIKMSFIQQSAVEQSQYIEFILYSIHVSGGDLRVRMNLLQNVIRGTKMFGTLNCGWNAATGNQSQASLGASATVTNVRSWVSVQSLDARSATNASLFMNPGWSGTGFGQSITL